MFTMKNVSVTELKANLSRYLDMVQRGSEVQVLDRNRPIARLVGLGADRVATKKEESEKLDRLERAGLIRRGKGDIRSFLDEPVPDIPGRSLVELVLEEREEGR